MINTQNDKYSKRTIHLIKNIGEKFPNVKPKEISSSIIVCKKNLKH